MELKVDKPALARQDIDPDTFQRVWGRVAPSQGALSPRGADAPQVTIPETAVPAQPSVSPGEAASPETPELAPVPSCPDLSSLPNVPDCPAQPECPACPECPSCPECQECPPYQECPDCPVQGTVSSCPSQPVQCAPTVCLGESSQGDSQRLEQLMTLAQTGAAAGRAMARRASGSCARALSEMAADHRLAFRRLSAAYFLINGERFSPKCPSLCLPSSLPLALRQQFGWERQWEQENCQAAQATDDPCLKELYLELAQEGALHAGTIRSLLEQMQ